MINHKKINAEENTKINDLVSSTSVIHKPTKSFKTLAIFLCLVLILAMLFIIFVTTRSNEKDVRIKVLEDKISIQQQQIMVSDNLKTQNLDLENQLKQVKTTLSDKNKSITEAGGKVSQYEADLKAKDEKISALNIQLVDTKEENGKLSSENASLSQKLNNIKNQVGSIFGIKN